MAFEDLMRNVELDKAVEFANRWCRAARLCCMMAPTVCLARGMRGTRTFLLNAGGRDSKSVSDIRSLFLRRIIVYEASPLF
jgi:hypothetical protein